MNRFAWTGPGPKGSAHWSHIVALRLDNSVLDHDHSWSLRRKIAFLLCSAASLWSLIGASLIELAH